MRALLSAKVSFITLLFILIICFCANAQQTPYGGTARTIPGRIEVEDFDEGGEGVAYHDQDETNNGGGLRLEEGVDIYSYGIIGWFRDGEWMEYTVDVEPGIYDFIMNLGTPRAGTILEVYLNDSLLLSYNVTTTGSWDPVEQVVSDLIIPKGGTGMILKLKNVNDDYDFDWVEFVKTDEIDPDGQMPYGGTSLEIPGRIEVEDFDEGGEGVAYHDTEPDNLGGAYRPNEGVDIQSGGIIGWFKDGEWLEYTVNVDSGLYDLEMHLATLNDDTELNIYLDDSLLISYDVPNTGSWDLETQVVYDIEIPKSSRRSILRLENVNNDYDIDWINFKKAASTIPPQDTYLFTHSFISENLPSGGGNAIQSLADYDNDGDLDMTIGSTSQGVFLFKKTNTGWVSSKIGSVPFQSLGAASWDVNNDGWVDLISAGVWYENIDGSSFTMHQYDEIFVSGNEFHDMVLADLNNDGKKDVIGMGDQTGFFWYDIADDPTGYWTRVNIDPDYPHSEARVHGGFSPAGIGDIDGDGDNDIFRADSWFENSNDGANWTKHDLYYPEIFQGSLPYGRSTRSYVIDIDNDGDNDIVFSNSDKVDAKAGIIENVSGDGSEWELKLFPQTADGRRCSLHALRVVDFNMDGMLDVMTVDQEDMMESGIPSPRWYMFTQYGGDWHEQVLFDMKLGGHDFLAGDVDQDGDVDIASKVWNRWGGNAIGGKHHADYLENYQVEQASSGIRLSPNVNEWTDAGGYWQQVGDYIVGGKDPQDPLDGGALLTKEKYGDFEIVCDVWPDWGVDSGIFLRTTSDGKKCYQVTVDYQVDNPMGGVYLEGMSGSVHWDYTIKNEDEIQAVSGHEPFFDLDAWSYIWKKNDWNQFRARIEGNPPSITTWINGWKVCEFTDTQKRLSNEGYVGLQVHPGTDWADGKLVRYKNIKIYSLDGAMDIAEAKSYSDIQYYPVPVTDILHIRNLQGESIISVFDIVGNKVLEKVSVTSSNQNLDMSGLKAGIYLVRIANDKDVLQNFKVIKN